MTLQLVGATSGSTPFTCLASCLRSLRNSNNELMGQINLVRVGSRHVSEGGLFTLTSGVLARKPMEGSAAISPINAGVEGFVRAAALELGDRARVNVVSPGWVSETLESMGRDPSQGVPASEVAQAYKSSVGGDQNGEVIEVLP